MTKAQPVINMRKYERKPGEGVPYLYAAQAWLGSIDAYLDAFDNPLNAAADLQEAIKVKLKETLKEALLGTQQVILVSNEDNFKPVLADAVGFLTAETAYSHPRALKRWTKAHLVNQYLKEFIDAQTAEMAADGAPIGVNDLALAKIQAKDSEQPTIDLRTSDGQSELSVDKATGDVDVNRIDQVTGEKKTFVTKKGFWDKTKDFFKSILNWFSTQWTKFKNWVKSFFSSPKDQDIIMKEAA